MDNEKQIMLQRWSPIINELSKLIKVADGDQKNLKEDQENIKLFYFSQFLNTILLKNLISY